MKILELGSASSARSTSLVGRLKFLSPQSRTPNISHPMQMRERLWKLILEGLKQRKGRAYRRI